MSMMSNLEQSQPMPLESPERQAQTVGFEEYRKLCDAATPSFRSTGIIEPEAYNRCLADPQTVWLTHQEKKVPYLVSIENAPGYDSRRCHELTKKTQVYLLCLPLSIVEGSERYEEGPDPSAAIIVESPKATTTEARTVLPSLISYATIWQPKEFLDPRNRDTEKQPATMHIFEAELAPPNTNTQKGAGNMQTAWRQYTHERQQSGAAIDPNNDAFFYSPTDLRGNKGLTEKLWAICESRFEELGRYHPVSMEESKDFFVNSLTADNTYTVIKYEDGEPVCFGFFSFGLNDCTWLSDTFKRSVEEGAQSNGQTIVYYPEIVRRKGLETQALQVIGLQTDLVSRLNTPVRLLFESSNRSAAYMPFIVQKYVAGTGSLRLTSEINELDSLHYWYLVNEAQ
jgi:hypothetical protein